MMPKSFRPMHDRVLIEPSKPKDKTEGGIVIPENARDVPNEGTVVACGKGRLLENGQVAPLDVKVGDKVLIEKYAGTDIKIDGKDYLMVSEANIIGEILEG